MSNDIQRPGNRSGAHHGPTVWTCECGARQVSLQFYRLPPKWMQLTMEIGAFDILEVKREERTLCPSCALDYQIRPAARRAARLLKK